MSVRGRFRRLLTFAPDQSTHQSNMGELWGDDVRFVYLDTFDQDETVGRVEGELDFDYLRGVKTLL